MHAARYLNIFYLVKHKKNRNPGENNRLTEKSQNARVAKELTSIFANTAK